ncbi:major capsid protein [Burkholderia gladioli]|uniref:major capsid protein n=1 Tax=Burkholderia gladioli TaxID=28095 RepID=UPI00264EE928|nr:hypothetical protein [Burkholderia gladioli]MDN7751744.1 hypothetical protein [Burkholderia gladioli]
MAILNTNNPTLLDIAKGLDPDGSQAQVIEILNQTNGIIEDATYVEGNLPTGHRTTVRSGLPTPTWRKLYGGVQPTKATKVQVTDNCGMLEDYAEVDKKAADLNGNTMAFRLSEDKAHIEGINQEFAQTTIYGNEGTAPAEFTGLSPRYNSLSAENKDNIIDAGGTGSDNTSIWLVVWSPETVHMITPKGSKTGLTVEDKGQVTIENADGNGGRMEGYRTHYSMDVGLSVRDWRYCARICNIDVSDLSQDANMQNLIKYMIMASEAIPNLGMGRAAWYVNRNIRTKLRLGILSKITNNLAWETVAGQRVMMFDDIPVRRTDAIINTEARVV